MKNPTFQSYDDFLMKVRIYKDVKLPDAMDVLRNVIPHVYNKTPYPELLYFLDHVQSKFSFLISNNDDFLGYSTSFLLDAGPVFLYGMRHPEDLKKYNVEIFTENMAFLKTQTSELISDFRFMISYRLKSKDGSWFNFSQRSCYIAQAPDGTPLAEIICVKHISKEKYISSNIHRIEIANSHKEVAVINMEKFSSISIINGEKLTKREVDVLKLAADGLCSKQIADKLSISIHTVNNHRKKMLVKTNCKNFPELLKLAIRSGIKI